MSELNHGDKCIAWNIDIKNKFNATYCCAKPINSRNHIVVMDNGATVEVRNVEKIPEKTIKKWDINTCPLPPFTVKSLSSNTYCTVMEINDGGVTLSVFSNFVKMGYDALWSGYKYIPDVNNRKLELHCGVENEQDN